MICEINLTKDKILDPQDRTVYEEALACLNTKAYRAAYIMFWISAVESLKRKFKDAASTGDSVASDIYSKLCNKEKNHEAIDRTLLDRAKDYGFIDDFEHGELNCIMTNRSVCAHPYTKVPNLVSIYHAAINIVNSVLSRPTELGEKYIDNFLSALKTPHFLPQDEQKALKSRISRIATRLLFYTYKKTIENLKEIPSDNIITINRYKFVLSIVIEKIPSDIKASESFHKLILSNPAYILSSLQTSGSLFFC